MEDEGKAQKPEAFYLWDISLGLFEIFQLACLFLQDDSKMSSGLLIRLIDERKLPLEKSLKLLYYAWAGYILEKNKHKTD